jgi:RNA polymerase sigma-70 factor (ECF subfamily)
MVDNEDKPELVSSGDSTGILSERARLGGRAAIEALYLRTLPSLISWIELRRRFGTGLGTDAGDLAQEVWVRVLANFARFDPALGPFRAWMFGIAKTVWLEQSSARRRGSAALAQASERQLGSLPDSVTSATRALARDESVALFLNHVQELEQVDRMIVIHHGMEGLSCAETGQRLDLSPEAVSKRWQRVQVRLREIPIGRDLVLDR